jgi:hypothetical protein
MSGAGGAITGADSGEDQDQGLSSVLTPSSQGQVSPVGAPADAPTRKKRGRPRVVAFLSETEKAARLERRRERNRIAARRCRAKKRREQLGLSESGAFSASEDSNEDNSQGPPASKAREPRVKREIASNSAATLATTLPAQNSNKRQRDEERATADALTDMPGRGFALPRQRLPSNSEPVPRLLAETRPQPASGNGQIPQPPYYGYPHPPGYQRAQYYPPYQYQQQTPWMGPPMPPNYGRMAPGYNYPMNDYYRPPYPYGGPPPGYGPGYGGYQQPYPPPPWHFNPFPPGDVPASTATPPAPISTPSTLGEGELKPTIAQARLDEKPMVNWNAYGPPREGNHSQPPGAPPGYPQNR